jgi:hypothetical protein
MWVERVHRQRWALDAPRAVGAALAGPLQRTQRLPHERHAPPPTHPSQVEGYSQAYDATNMLFMDYRRHHSGLWEGAARHLEQGGRVLTCGSDRALTAASPLTIVL